MSISSTIDATIGGFNLAQVKDLSAKATVAFVEALDPKAVAEEASTEAAPVSAEAVKAVLVAIKAKI